MKSVYLLTENVTNDGHSRIVDFAANPVGRMPERMAA
jgi:hypothetical protein